VESIFSAGSSAICGAGLNGPNIISLQYHFNYESTPMLGIACIIK